MRRIVVASLVICACSWSSATKKDVVETRIEETKGSFAATTTRTQAETKIDTQTVHQELAVVVEVPDGGVEIVRVPEAEPAKLPPGSKVQGTVPLSSTTTQQHEAVGPVTAVTAVTADQIKKADEKTVDKTETKKATHASFQIYFIVASVVVILAAAIGVYVRFFRRV